MRVSGHAVARYQERVKPALSREQAAQDIVRVLALAERRPGAPAWVTSQEYAEEWFVLADEIAFPVRFGEVTTCLTRSWGDEVREQRSEGGQRHRRRRKNAPGYRTKNGKVAREARRRRRELREGVDG